MDIKYTTDEFSEYDIPKIMECIENPEVGNVRIRPGLTNREKIVGLRNEDKFRMKERLCMTSD